MSHRQVTMAQARRIYVADDSGQNLDLLPTWTCQHGRLLEVFGQNIVRKSKVSDRQTIAVCRKVHQIAYSTSGFDYTYYKLYTSTSSA